jgi:hypothetical protein
MVTIVARNRYEPLRLATVQPPREFSKSGTCIGAEDGLFPAPVPEGDHKVFWVVRCWKHDAAPVHRGWHYVAGRKDYPAGMAAGRESVIGVFVRAGFIVVQMGSHNGGGYFLCWLSICFYVANK